jgi:hypothetical protein
VLSTSLNQQALDRSGDDWEGTEFFHNVWIDRAWSGDYADMDEYAGDSWVGVRRLLK